MELHCYGQGQPRPPGEAMNTDVRTTPAYDVGAGGTLLSPNMDMAPLAQHEVAWSNGSVFTSYIEIAELIMSGGNGGRVHRQPSSACQKQCTTPNTKWSTTFP